MSHISVRPLTDSEFDLLEALDNLAVSGANQAIQKTSASTFSNVTFGTGGGVSIGGIVTGGTSGSVLFVNPDGILAQDNANFYWDDTNNTLILGGTTSAGTGNKLRTLVSATATPNYGVLSMGAGAFDGSTLGFFVGSANGTQIAINMASGSTANFVDFQLAGAARFLVALTGEVDAVNMFLSSSSNSALKFSTAGGGIGFSNANSVIYTDSSNTMTSTVVGNSTAAYRFTWATAAANNTQTSGTAGLASWTTNFSPTSGTAAFNVVGIFTTTNQTGGASGAVREIYISPTKTATANWRGIEIAAAPQASSVAGTLTIGSGPFDGSTLGFFNGSSAGTHIAVNMVSGGTSDFINFQLAGANRFKVASTGAVTLISNVALQFGSNNSSIIGDTVSVTTRVSGTSGGSVVSKYIEAGNADISTSGTTTLHLFSGGYAPTSGTGIWSSILINGTVNQTGGANGNTFGIRINPTLTAVGGIYTYLDCASGATTQFSVLNGGKINTYNAITTVSNGVASEVATIDTTGLTANVGASTLYVVPASGEGMYRVSAYLVTTTAGSISSTMPNAQVVFTDKDSNTSVTLDVSPILGAAGLGQSGLLTANTAGTVFSGTTVIYVKASTTIQYQTVNYASTAAGMTYSLRMKLEAL